MTKPSDSFEAAKAISHIAPLMSLEEKVRPEHTAVVVIDMQNDFCAQEGMCDREGFDISGIQTMARRLPDFLDAARKAGVHVIFVRNVYSTEGTATFSDQDHNAALLNIDRFFGQTASLSDIAACWKA